MVLASDTIYELVTAVPLFAKVDKAVLERILTESSAIEPDKGQIIFVQGAKAEFLYITLSGWIKLFRETKDGHEAVTALCTHGDLFGEATLYHESNYPFGAQAVEDAVCLRVPAKAVRECVQQDKAFSSALFKAISKRLQSLELHTEHLQVMTTAQRVGCYLLKLCSAKKEPQTNILLPHDKTLVAGFLGMKLETFSRALATLKEIGITVKGPIITVSDINELQKYVCGNCSLEPGACKSDDD